MKRCTTTDALRRSRRGAAGRSPSSTSLRDCRGTWVVMSAFWFPAVLCCLVFCESVDVAAAGSVQMRYLCGEESLADIFIRIFGAVLLAKGNPAFLFSSLVFHCPFGGNSDRLTWVRHSSCKSSATHSYQWMQYFRVWQQWHSCQW